MGGFVGFITGIVAIASNYYLNNDFLFWIAVVATIINFWTWGMMHNYYVSEKHNINAVPDWMTQINLITFIIIAIILVVGWLL